RRAVEEDGCSGDESRSSQGNRRIRAVDGRGARADAADVQNVDCGGRGQLEARVVWRTAEFDDIALRRRIRFIQVVPLTAAEELCEILAAGVVRLAAVPVGVVATDGDTAGRELRSREGTRFILPEPFGAAVAHAEPCGLGADL